jgi:hypothetical protein
VADEAARKEREREREARLLKIEHDVPFSGE